MKTKTWKLGEWAIGGIITAQVTPAKITVICKEWDFAAGSNRGSNQSNAQEFDRAEASTNQIGLERIEDTLRNWTTIYYAGQILDWIEQQIKQEIRA